MIIVETPHHITFRYLQDMPIAACTGKCKKVFWKTDIENDAATKKCTHCGDTITDAVNDKHFTVLSKANRNLKLSDFKKVGVIKSSDKKQIQAYLALNAKVMHLSLVKPQFEQKAISEWMPNGMTKNVSIKI